jgi:hypothetical protein
MSVRNKDKDHLQEHGGVELVTPLLSPTSDDPLRFWTDHPTENTLVDLHLFADGETENPTKGSWAGPFSGRPALIAELAVAAKARLTFATESTWRNYKFALRSFWRVFDQMESTTTSEGRALERLSSIRDLNPTHEAAAHQAKIDPTRFSIFVLLVNDSRRLLRLSPLPWTTPKPETPIRQSIPDDQAKALRIAIKRDWQRVMETWSRHDAIRRGEEPVLTPEQKSSDLASSIQYVEQNDILRRNWLHFEAVQKRTGVALPTPTQIFEGASKEALRYYHGIASSAMQAIVFPTVAEADIAFHMALAGSGWNPSTLILGVDATVPDRVFPHPKDQKQSVLALDEQNNSAENSDEVTMQGVKRRAGGRMQFCMGLKKNPASPPNIVAAYIERTAELRQQLRIDGEKSRAKLASMKLDGAPSAQIEHQFKHFQKLQQGIRNVWLYVEVSGKINWIDGKNWSRYRADTNDEKISYLDRVIGRLNFERTARGETVIPRVLPSDLRDIFARWVHTQSGGNVLAVMHALGHAGLKSTDGYLDNNIYSQENDETVRRFMTHLFAELQEGRIDLTILAQLVRHGPLTPAMQQRLTEYRQLMRSRVKVACADVKHPPPHVSPDHIAGTWCGTHRCLRRCPHARFLPESIDGIAMRVEELLVMSEQLPVETWLRGGFESELESGEYLLAELYPTTLVNDARAHWRRMIATAQHVVPGVGLIRPKEVA